MMIFIAFIVLCYCQCLLSKHILKEYSNHPVRRDFRLGNRAQSDLVHDVVFSIQQNNMEQLEAILYDVSTKESVNYGKHLSYEEVGALIENREATDAVLAWLNENNVVVTSTSEYGEFIKCSASVEKWEEMFQTTFHEYHDVVDSSLSTMEYSKYIRSKALNLPDTLAHHIATVFNTADLPPRLSKSLPLKKVDRPVSADGLEMDFTFNSNNVVPSKLFSMYGITGDSAGYGSLAIYETSSDTFLQSDLLLFQQTFGLTEDEVDHYVGSFPNNNKCNTDISECSESSLDIQYILAVAPNTPSTFWYSSVNEGSFLSFITSVSASHNPPKVFSISWSSYEEAIQPSSLTAFNTEAIKLGARGVSLLSAAGDDGVTGFLFPNTIPIANCGYYAQFPASSPFVTAIGGTQDGIALNGKPEIACSSDTGAGITTGGGFSGVFATPYWQKYAVGNYSERFTGKQPASNRNDDNGDLDRYSYNARGYPDISSAASNYYVLIGGDFYVFAGTSASTPVVAGMIALVNSQLLQLGKSTLGWLNPSIYSNNGQFANDITKGNNRCTKTVDGNQKPICCDLGFNATVGWDPVTGFGSVDYPRLLNYYLGITPSPTAPPTTRPTHAPTVNPTPRPSAPPTTRPTRAPTVNPTPRPSALPTFRPTRAPTYYPTESLPAHTNVAIDIEQEFSASYTAAEANDDPSAYSAMNRILLELFAEYDILSVDIHSFADTPSRRLSSSEFVLMVNPLYISYTLTFALNDLNVTDATISSLQARITDHLSLSITSGDFTTLLASSSSTTLASSTSTAAPTVLAASATFVSGGDDDEESSSSDFAVTYIIIIAAVGGFILLAGIFATVMLCMRKKPATAAPVHAQAPPSSTNHAATKHPEPVPGHASSRHESAVAKHHHEEVL